MSPFLMINMVTEQIYVISLFGNVACINFRNSECRLSFLLDVFT